MKPLLWTSPSLVTNLNRALLRVAPLVLLTVVPTLSAQSVISTPTAVPNTPPAFPQPPASDSAPQTLSQGSPFQWGFVTAHPHLDYRFLYGDGIQSSPGKQNATSIQTVAPGVLLNVGTHWTFDYTANQTYYSDAAFKDTLDHSLRLLGGTVYEEWTLQFSQTFSSTFDPLIETGRQTGQDTYDTAATVGYHLSDKFQLTTNFAYQARFATVFSDSRETTIGERVHYQFLPRVDASLGFDYGTDDVKSGIDMTFTRPSAQLDWRTTDKLSFNLNAGVENRKFRIAGGSDLKSPIFGAGLVFRPFMTTTINFAASRGVSVSYFSNQVTRNTEWSVNLQQRLLGHFYLSAGYSGQKAQYISTDPLLSANRNDKNYSFNARISTVVFQRATVGILYQNSHNDSNSAGFGFTSSQVGLELGYRF